MTDYRDRVRYDSTLQVYRTTHASPVKITTLTLNVTYHRGALDVTSGCPRRVGPGESLVGQMMLCRDTGPVTVNLNINPS